MVNLLIFNLLKKSIFVWVIRRSIMVVGVAVGLWGCAAKGEAEMEKAEKMVVPVVPAVRQDVTLHNDYVAEIHAVQNVEIRARVKGFLEKILVDEGKFVRKGQLLFQINNEEYQAELAKAKANLKSAIAESKAAEVELQRVKMLVEKNVVATTEVDLAKARLAAAQARIEEAQSMESNAKVKLGYTSIRAPFDGVIDRIPMKIGSVIDEGTLLTTVSDVSAVYTYFKVSEKEYLQYMHSAEKGEEGQAKVELYLADGSRYPQAGKVETMEGEFESTTGSIAFRAKFPNPGRLLKHGSTGKINLTNQVDSALIVPQKATFEIQDKVYVFVLDKQ